MTQVLEVEKCQIETIDELEDRKFKMRMFFEVKRKLGICITEYESFNDYLAALFQQASDGTLKGALQLPGKGSFDWIIEEELKKREVYV